MIDYHKRKATPGDLKASYEIRKNALGEYVRQTWGWDENWQWEYHLKDFNPDIMYMIDVNGEPIATLEVEIKEDAILVSGIYIIFKYQSKGIGLELMKNVIADAAKEYKPVKLQVLKVNGRAKEFYLRLGFEICSENNTHYQMIYKNWSIKYR